MVPQFSILLMVNMNYSNTDIYYKLYNILYDYFLNECECNYYSIDEYNIKDVVRHNILQCLETIDNELFLLNYGKYNTNDGI